MKIVSWNVNGIRACAKKGFLSWLEEASPDVLLLQETKAWPDQLDAELLESHGYHCVWATAEKKGYSGVSTWSRRAPDDHQIGLGIERFDREGRTVITDHGRLRIFNGYFPNGQRDHGRVPYKLDYYAAVLDAAELAPRGGSYSSAATGTRLTVRWTSLDPKPTARPRGSCPRSAPGWIAGLTPATTTPFG